MRDFIVLAIILASMPISFFQPYYGILIWYWIAYFNPHRLAYSIHYYPVAQAIAIPTLLGLFFDKKLNVRIFTRETLIVVALLIWFCFTLGHAYLDPTLGGHLDSGFDKLVNVSKILLMTGVTVMLLTTRERIHWLMMVVAFSFGMLAIKGTVFGLATGGGSRIYGPENSFVADNNALGLALDMCLPIFFFLARQEKRRTFKLGLYAAFLCAILGVILTYSRGALLGLMVVMPYIAIRARRKAITAILMVPVVFGAITFAPQAWHDRMNQFFSGNLDDSAKDRIIVWRTALAISLQYPIVGGGLDCFSDPAVHLRFQPEKLPNNELQTGPHSIYFQMLGEHGYPGLLLFLSLIGSCFISLFQLRRKSRLCPQLDWMGPYTFMVEGSILGFMISGAFLEFAYFDLWFLLVGIIAAMKILAQKEYHAWLYELSNARGEAEERNAAAAQLTS